SAPHLMKLRYTPLQHALHTAEEYYSPLPGTLDGLPVVAAELHSQAAAAAAGIQAAAPGARVAYVMPDTAALPLALSRLVPRLRETGLLALTITCGQAFGGDLEAISFPSALAAARAAGAHAVIVAQGPGNAGTGTPLGFSGIAQADWLNNAHAMGGTSLAAARISFADPRPRHRGLSHHTLTVLSTFCLCPVVVAVPVLPPAEAEYLQRQLTPLRAKHRLETHDGAPALHLLEKRGIPVTTMGRSMAADRAFFLAAGAAGIAAAKRIGRTGEDR
ncbi:MAG: DUF3866 family protein, partial [Armatimonadota bacterium]|nr:DUF3866 family protein [Armatimonadota bacterium]